MIAILSTYALSAPAPAAAGSGYLAPYTLVGCTQTGAVAAPRPILPQDECVKVATFTSFQAGVLTPCAAGKIPSVFAFYNDDCTGTSVGGGSLPTSGAPGTCEEIVLTVDNGAKVGGKAAQFKCI